MSATTNIWDKLSTIVLALLAVAFILGAWVFYQPVGEVNERMREQKLALDRHITDEEKIGRRLETQLHSFQNPALERTMVERLARERLSYAKPGEFVIHFDAPAATAIH